MAKPISSLLSNVFDEQFNKLHNEGILTWFPWVGKQYIQSSPKVLMLWESHYGEVDCESDENFTRNVFYDSIIEQDVLFPAFENALAILGVTPTRKAREDFFSCVAACNIIQRIMSNAKERPTIRQFEHGCQMFSKLRQILKPDVCIFWGVTVCNTLHSFSDDQGDYGEVESCQDEKIGNCYPRYGELSDKTKILGIIHPARCPQSRIQDWQSWIYDSAKIKSIVDCK